MRLRRDGHRIFGVPQVNERIEGVPEGIDSFLLGLVLMSPLAPAQGQRVLPPSRRLAGFGVLGFGWWGLEGQTHNP